MKNGKYNTLDVKKRCENKLGIQFNGKGKSKRGDHFNGWYSLEGIRIAKITVPKGRKPIPPKTYKSMATQLKLTIGQFDDLLDCPLNQEGYNEIVKDSI